MEPVWLRTGGAPRSAMRKLSYFGHDPAVVWVICVEPFAYCAELNAFKGFVVMFAVLDANVVLCISLSLLFGVVSDPVNLFT